MKTTKRYYFTPTRMTTITKADSYKVLSRMWKIFWWVCKLVQPLWKAVWNFLEKLNMCLSYNPAILLLGFHPQENKSIDPHQDSCVNVYTALFMIAKTGKNANLRQLVYLSSRMLKNKKYQNAGTCDMDECQSIVLKWKEPYRKKLYMVEFHLYKISRKGKAEETERWSEVALGWEWEQGLVANGHERALWSDGIVLTLYGGDVCTVVYIY